MIVIHNIQSIAKLPVWLSQVHTLCVCVGTSAMVHIQVFLHPTSLSRGCFWSSITPSYPYITPQRLNGISKYRIDMGISKRTEGGITKIVLCAVYSYPAALQVSRFTCFKFFYLYVFTYILLAFLNNCFQFFFAE